MTHRLFDIIGERTILVDTAHKTKEGIFLESEDYQTTAEGKPRPALDFIVPMYRPNPIVEELAKGRIPRERINPHNPVLSINLGIDHLKLNYISKNNGIHLVKGELEYVMCVFFNDGNFEVFDKYKKQLREVGFKIGEN